MRKARPPRLSSCGTVLVVPRNFEPTYSEIWERDPDNEDDVDFVTDDLAGFLTRILGGAGG